MKNPSKIINWSEVSRLLTNDRTAIRADYSGKKYKKQVDRLNRLAMLFVKWVTILRSNSEISST